MDDLISRQAVLYAINKTYEDTVKGIDRHSTVHGLISAVTGIYKNTICLLPSVQPEPKSGRWTGDNACSECGYQPWFSGDIHNYSFCPNCGADMREVTK